MDYPFRMYGDIVQIYKYKIGDEYAYYLDEAQAMSKQLGVDYVTLDTSEYEWIDGLNLSTRNHAIDVYKAGKEAYEASLQEQTDIAETISKLQTQVLELQTALNMILTGVTE